MGPHKKVRGRHTQGEGQVRTGAGTGAEGAEIGGRIAVASLFIDLAGDIPFHTTSEIAVRKQN